MTTKGVGIYAPHGDLVAAIVPEAKARLKALVAGSEGDFTVDLEGVEMIDSKGHGLLIAACNSLSAENRRLRIVHASPDIVELFETMRLDRHFAIE
jgi:anti-anti-sigma factor